MNCYGIRKGPVFVRLMCRADRAGLNAWSKGGVIGPGLLIVSE